MDNFNAALLKTSVRKSISKNWRYRRDVLADLFYLNRIQRRDNNWADATERVLKHKAINKQVK